MTSPLANSIPAALRCYEAKAQQFVEDAAWWFKCNLKIIDRKNRLIPFVVNSQQRSVLFWVGMQLAAGVPVRIIILKARRMGMSTLITALGFYFAILRPNYPAFACAHDAAGTETLRAMCKTFQEELPEHIQRETKYDSIKGLVCAPPHRSSYRFHTAGKKEKSGLGRSKEITYLHISEKAWIAHFAQVAAGIKSCVPRFNPLSCIFEESTANGEYDDGQFHESWQAAVKQRKASPTDLRGYIPLFFSWLDFPQYRETAPEGYDWGEITDQELRLKALGANEEQLYFRRIIISQEFNGDTETFAQEYPATPEEAFRASGSPVFSQKIIEFHESLVRPPARKVLLRRDAGKIVASDAPDDCRNYWEVWGPPVPECDYAVGGDVAEGKLSDPEDERSDRDCSAGFVLNRRYFRQDAIWVGQIPADEWGQELRKCAEWYNDAWGSPEANAAGQAALVAWKTYNRVYQRQPSEPVGTEERDLTEIGYKTTGGNRDYMIDMYLAACSDNEVTRIRAGFTDRLRIYSEKLVEEEKAFVRKKNGKREHREGKRDDILFAAFIAIQIHLSCPRTLVPPDYKEPGRPVLDSRWVGGIAGPDDDEEPVTYDTLTST